MLRRAAMPPLAPAANPCCQTCTCTSKMPAAACWCLPACQRVHAASQAAGRLTPAASQSGRRTIHHPSIQQPSPTSTLVAPASSAFSTSSLTAVARSKMTCPEHILWMDWLLMGLMAPATPPAAGCCADVLCIAVAAACVLATGCCSPPQAWAVHPGRQRGTRHVPGWAQLTLTLQGRSRGSKRLRHATRGARTGPGLRCARGRRACAVGESGLHGSGCGSASCTCVWS